MNDYHDDPAIHDDPAADDEAEKEEARYLDPDLDLLTPIGNAKRLVARHGETFRYIPELRDYFVWDGRRWKPGSHEEMMRLAKDTVLTEYHEAEQGAGGIDSKAAKWAVASMTEHRLQEAINLAGSEPDVDVAITKFDADPYLLNVLNGTVDLRTGTLRPHRKEDLITKLAPVWYPTEFYGPGSTRTGPNLWETFLARAIPDNETREYFQETVGEAIIGQAKSRKVHFMHGPGRTSKSTVLEALKTVLGDYAAMAPFDTFLKNENSDRKKNELARLVGVRLVISSETAEGKEWDKEEIKHITGRDTIEARKLYHDAFTFTPQFTIIISANHKPSVDAHDQAFWDRLYLIPFDQRLKPEEVRENMLDILEQSGMRTEILTWALEGSLRRQARGDRPLTPPCRVLRHTETYRLESDTVALWIQERCEVGPEFEMSAGALRGDYERWCLMNDKVPVPKGTKWGEALREKEFWRENTPGRKQDVWHGFRVKGIPCVGVVGTGSEEE